MSIAVGIDSLSASTAATSTYGTLTWGALSGDADSEFVIKWAPSTTGAPTWWETGFRSLNTDNTTYNHVFRQGWNIASGGGRVDGSKPSFEFEIESNYWNGSRFQGEIHISSNDLSGVIHRYISIEAPHSGTGSNLLIKADQGQIGNESVGFAAWNVNGFNIASPNAGFKVTTGNSGIVLEYQAATGPHFPRVSIDTANVNIGGNLNSDRNNGGVSAPYDIGASTGSWGTAYVTSLKLSAGSAVAVSDAGQGRFRYNQNTNKAQVSLNGAAYIDLLAGSYFDLSSQAQQFGTSGNTTDFIQFHSSGAYFGNGNSYFLAAPGDLSINIGGVPYFEAVSSGVNLGAGGTDIFLVGSLRWPVGQEQTTVGAVGGASAPPATPLKWLKVKLDDGTLVVIPGYRAS